jgi:hypothetical protein
MLFSSLLQASNFDDAVNLYLKGFDHCTKAKELLSNNRVGAARSALNQYNAITSQASAMDGSILKTNKRGMDSNLRFCERVATDIELTQGKPILDQAIASCAQVSNALGEGDLDQAQASYAEFSRLKAQALDAAPSLNDQYSARSQISRCERLERKITRFQEKHEGQQLVVERTLDNGDMFLATCRGALQDLKKNPVSKNALAEAQKGLSSARNASKIALSDGEAIKVLSQPAYAAEKSAFDDKIKQGNQCIAAFSAQIEKSKTQLSAIEVELTKFNQTLAKANTSCGEVLKNDAKNANAEQYQRAKKYHASAMAARNQVKESLAKTSHFKDRPDWAEMRAINSSMIEVNACLERSKAHLNAMFSSTRVVKKAPAAVVAPVPVSVPVAVKKPTSVTKADVPAESISGTINMLSAIPEFAVAYMLDGVKKAEQGEIIIKPSGFDKKNYIVKNGDSLKIKSRDFAFHRISIDIAGIDYSDTLGWIQSRQSKQVDVNWPENSIATLRSDRATIVPAHIANISSGNHVLISFNEETGKATFTLDNVSGAKKGFILMSDFDPIEINLSKDKTANYDVIRDAAVHGSVVLQGL